MVTVCALDLQFKEVPTSVCYNIVENSTLLLSCLMQRVRH